MILNFHKTTKNKCEAMLANCQFIHFLL
ncbi:MAG: hypothetical protein ACI9QR_001169, partial [Flavobacteriaceae bacterium]